MKALILVLLLVLAGNTDAEWIEAVVEKVRDADTIEVFTETDEYLVIRLAEIQCAEMSTQRGVELGRMINGLLLGETVIIKTVGIGYYGRTLGHVYHNQVHINQWLLANYCPPYR